MIDVAAISLAEIIIGITFIATVVGGGAIMKYRQDKAETTRIEDRNQAKLDRKNNRDFFERELKRIEQDHKDTVKNLREEMRTDRDNFTNHSNASEGIRNTLTSLMTHWEHFAADLTEIKKDLKEVRKNGYGQKENS